jgi:CubicO group peptidase (beta-lactamase class C family)
MNVPATLFAGCSVVLSLWAAAPAGAQAHGGRAYSDVPTARVDSLFSDLDSERSPGCALGVYEAGEPVYMNGYGMASLEHGIPMTPRSVVNTASVSKQFTALAIILLARAGELSLDDPVRDYIPELPGYVVPVTLRHLIHHTSGLRDSSSLLVLARGQLEADGDPVMMSLLGWQNALSFPPGEYWMYFTGGYALLAMVVERVSGESFREFTHREIFAPLGMAESGFHWPAAIHGLALAYAPHGEDGYRLSIPTHTFAGPAGLYTTIEDLAKWDGNFYHMEVGGSDGIALMHAPGRLSSGEELTYAAGLELGSYRGLPTASHSGGDPGYATMMVRFPDQRLSVALLCNVTSAAPWYRVYEVADLYLEDYYLEPSPASAETVVDDLYISEPDFETLIGVYRSADGIVVNLFDHEDGALVVTFGSARFPLEAIGERQFGDDSSPYVLTFTEPGAGEGVTATWRPNPLHDSGGSLSLERVGSQWEPSPRDLMDFTGSFFSEELDATWEIVAGDEMLVLRRWGMPDQALEPLLPDTWVFLGTTEPRLRFERDAAGTVTSLSLSNSQILGMKFVRSTR